MRDVFVAAAALCLLASAAEAAGGDAEAGAKKAQACAGCHTGAGAPGAPWLAGQQDRFLQWQLVFFRSGRRENPIMSKLAEGLSDEDVRDVGAYYASLPPFEAQGDDKDAALRDAGAALAEQHHCANCHTETFTGKQAVARLAGQREDYLRKALADYRSGSRPSTGVGAMTEAASGLSDEDIAAVAHYLATLR
jgi:cytochrome c553